MITQCPFCGCNLPNPITNGITSCANCFRVFDSSLYHRLLSASWICRRHNVVYEDQLIHQYGYDENEAKFVIKWVVNECYTHEEFRQFLLNEGCANDTYRCN